MKYAYYESKWKADELDGKKIEFLYRNRWGAQSIFGKLRIHVHGNLISVCICRDTVHPERLDEDIWNLWNPELVDRIEPHPDKSVADFRLAE